MAVSYLYINFQKLDCNPHQEASPLDHRERLAQALRLLASFVANPAPHNIQLKISLTFGK